MSPELTLLIRLQHIESDTDAARRAIDELPARRAAIETGIMEAEEALAAAKARVSDNQAGRRAVEKDLAALQTRLSRYKDQLMEVKTNKEYVAMQHEIATASDEVKALEDKLLELMLEGDELAVAAKNAELAVRDRRGQSVVDLEHLEEERASLETRIARAAGERAEVAARLDAKSLALFEFVRQRRQVAVVEARDGHCTVCHVRLRPQIYNDIRTNEHVVQCDSCLRILYFVAPPSPPAASPG